MRNWMFVIALAALATGCEMKGGETSVTTTGKVPIPAVNQKEIMLTWDKSTGEVEGYKIEISLDGTNFVELGYLRGHSGGVILPPLDSGAKYYFRVRAFNQGGNGAYSPVSSVSI